MVNQKHESGYKFTASSKREIEMEETQMAPV